MTMRIAVVGAGAMGSLFGGKLSAVAQVTLLDPWAEHVAAMQQDGLSIVELDGSKMTVPVTATTDPAAVPTVDMAIIFVKAHTTPQASQWASRFLAPGPISDVETAGRARCVTIEQPEARILQTGVIWRASVR